MRFTDLNLVSVDCRSTHKWTTYVRSASNEDLSVIIKKVVFQLHPSFEKPIRTIEAAPFELSESGWGEFEIGITIHFHPDVAEKPLELYGAFSIMFHSQKYICEMTEEHPSTRNVFV